MPRPPAGNTFNKPLVGLRRTCPRICGGIGPGRRKCSQKRPPLARRSDPDDGCRPGFARWRAREWKPSPSRWRSIRAGGIPPSSSSRCRRRPCRNRATAFPRQFLQDNRSSSASIRGETILTPSIVLPQNFPKSRSSPVSKRVAWPAMAPPRIGTSFNGNSTSKSVSNFKTISQCFANRSNALSVYMQEVGSGLGS